MVFQIRFRNYEKQDFIAHKEYLGLNVIPNFVRIGNWQLPTHTSELMNNGTICVQLGGSSDVYENIHSFMESLQVNGWTTIKCE